MMTRSFAMSALLLGALGSHFAFRAPMNAKTVELPAFSIIGIEARTNNAKEMSNDGIIPKQWGRFVQEGILEKIPDKVDSTVYAVYTDYESDRTGDYTFILGAKVKAGTTPPAGLVLKKIPVQRYTVFTSNRGLTSEVVPGIWKRIWDIEDSKEIRRSYLSDFEVYDQRAVDSKNTQVDVYLGTK
jgi:predicted transcriptional regulator YdeE